MEEPMIQSHAGWKIVQSISMELDAALSIAGGHFLAAGITPEIVALQQSNSADWKKEWDEFFGSMTWYNSTMEYASILAGVLDEADYSTSTLAIRQTTVESALQRLKSMAAEVHLDLTSDLPIEEAVVQLFIQYRKFAFESIGFSHPVDPLYETRAISEIHLCLDIFQGGKNHDRFWHWLDHFYYEVYRPWRDERKPFLVGLEQKLITVLGTPQAYARVPDLQWLPDLNPALRYPEIGAAVQTGALFVNYWLEPFGFSDNFALLPGQLYLSYAEPGTMYENFLKYSQTLASRVQALADPTRLIILRMIRALSMTNTDMAAYLGLSRPTVSIHAKVLREAGLINSWEDGRITRHEINPLAVRKLFHELEEFLDLPSEQKNI